MSFFKYLFDCFTTKSDSQISSTEEISNSKVLSLKKPKSPRAPIIVSYFPVGSNLSRL
ncbi:unnamed protein product [Cochlearia groenlandica]